jgi:hypothetical protein
MRIDLDANKFLSDWTRNKTNLSIIAVKFLDEVKPNSVLKGLKSKALRFVPVLPNKNAQIEKLVKKSATVFATQGKPKPLGEIFNTLDAVSEKFPKESVFEVMVFIQGFDDSTDAETYEYVFTLMIKKVEK